MAEDAGDKERAHQGYHYRCLARLELGDVPGVYADLDAQTGLAKELRQPAQEWYVAAVRATLATFEGRLEELEGTLGRVARDFPTYAVLRAALAQLYTDPSVDDPITVRVTLTADALDAGVAYTRTDTYYTFNDSISIPPSTTGHVEAQTCNVPPDISFWRMSTHTHKQAVSAVVKDGEPISTDIVFESTDWEQPGAITFDAPDFFSFVTDRVTYECTYDNPTIRTIESGHSAATDEQCVAVGYYFPATKPLLCFDGLGPF